MSANSEQKQYRYKETEFNQGQCADVKEKRTFSPRAVVCGIQQQEANKESDEVDENQLSPPPHR